MVKKYTSKSYSNNNRQDASPTILTLAIYCRMVLNCKYLLTANCKFSLRSQLMDSNMHVYYNMVWGQPSQLLDSYMHSAYSVSRYSYTINHFPR